MFRVIQRKLIIYPKRHNPIARPPIDKKLISEIDDVKYSNIKFSRNKSLIKVMDDTVKNSYLKKSHLNFNLNEYFIEPVILEA